jgi:hypothetical protein
MRVIKRKEGPFKSTSSDGRWSVRVIGDIIYPENVLRDHQWFELFWRKSDALAYIAG